MVAADRVNLAFVPLLPFEPVELVPLGNELKNKINLVNEGAVNSVA